MSDDNDDNLRRDRARQLRRAQTDAEKKLWDRLRGGKLHGVKFRRQFPIGPFFADFCAAKELLVIELDGSQHLEGMVRDDARTKYLERLGYRVARFWDSDALASTDEVIQEITDCLKTLLSRRGRVLVAHRRQAEDLFVLRAEVLLQLRRSGTRNFDPHPPREDARRPLPDRERRLRNSDRADALLLRGLENVTTDGSGGVVVQPG